MNAEVCSESVEGTKAGMVLRNIMLLIITPWSVPLVFVLWKPHHVDRPMDLLALGGCLVLSVAAIIWCYRIGRRYRLFGPDKRDGEEIVPADEVKAINIRLGICFVVLVLPAMGLGVMGPVLL